LVLAKMRTAETSRLLWGLPSLQRVPRFFQSGKAAGAWNDHLVPNYMPSWHGQG